jgi:hypothetical protein
MEKVTARVNYWVPADSESELVKELRHRYGGSLESWKHEVRRGLRDGCMVPERQNGRMGYRTLNEEERASDLDGDAIVSSVPASQAVMA